MGDFLSSVEGLADLLLWRDGGQRQARRNAWRAMVVDNARARARAEAADALGRLDDQQVVAVAVP
jgi:hypothetical protein